MTTKTAAERIAAIRDEYARFGENVDHLSDLDLLNQYAETRERERIDTNDRYMRLLTEMRKHDEQVRAAAAQTVRERLDVLACEAVSRKAGELTRILGAVEVLPERANAERVALLKSIAADTRRTLRLISEFEADEPAKSWRLDDNRALVAAARSVIGVLRDKEGVTAADVIRLVGEALTPNGNLRDLFDVADAAPIKQKQPVFAGGGWAEMGGGSYYAYEPDGSRYRVVAYALGDTWWLDLQGPTGALIAAGETSQSEVSALAASLIKQAPELAKSGLRPWQCWQNATRRNVTEIRMQPHTQPALFTDDDVQTEGYAQPEPRDEDTAVEETEHVEPEAEAA